MLFINNVPLHYVMFLKQQLTLPTQATDSKAEQSLVSLLLPLPVSNLAVLRNLVFVRMLIFSDSVKIFPASMSIEPQYSFQFSLKPAFHVYLHTIYIAISYFPVKFYPRVQVGLLNVFVPYKSPVKLNIVTFPSILHVSELQNIQFSIM